MTVIPNFTAFKRYSNSKQRYYSQLYFRSFEKSLMVCQAMLSFSSPTPLRRFIVFLTIFFPVRRINALFLFHFIFILTDAVQAKICSTNVPQRSEIFYFFKLTHIQSHRKLNVFYIPVWPF